MSIVYRFDGCEVPADDLARALCIVPPVSRAELERAVSAVRTRQPEEAAHILALLGITFERTTP